MRRSPGKESLPGLTLMPKTLSSILVRFVITKTFLLNVISAVPSRSIFFIIASNGGSFVILLLFRCTIGIKGTTGSGGSGGSGGAGGTGGAGGSGGGGGGKGTGFTVRVKL